MKKIFVLIMVILIAIWGVYYNYQNKVYKNKKNSQGFVSFTISQGESVQDIANNLLVNGLIDSVLFFKIYIWQTDSSSQLQAGVYELDKSISISKIVNKFIKGKTVSDEQEIKILEGWTIKDINDYLMKNNIINDNIFQKKASQAVNNWEFSFAKFSFLQQIPRGFDLEGYLFPDTYRIFKQASAEDVIKKMLDNFNKKITPVLYAEIEKQHKTIPEIITMASIIEKEVRDKNDMAIVAGILYKRLSLGMRLEVDSTVNYATGASRASVTWQDLQIDSPFNTYQHSGLPPGPICNPGIEAIKAAIYPQTSDYLFYLNRQDTGETIFSKTFSEHIRNKNKYLK